MDEVVIISNEEGSENDDERERYVYSDGVFSYVNEEDGVMKTLFVNHVPEKFVFEYKSRGKYAICMSFLPASNVEMKARRDDRYDEYGYRRSSHKHADRKNFLVFESGEFLYETSSLCIHLLENRTTLCVTELRSRGRRVCRVYRGKSIVLTKELHSLKENENTFYYLRGGFLIHNNEILMFDGKELEQSRREYYDDYYDGSYGLDYYDLDNENTQQLMFKTILKMGKRDLLSDFGMCIRNRKQGIFSHNPFLKANRNFLQFSHCYQRWIINLLLVFSQLRDTNPLFENFPDDVILFIIVPFISEIDVVLSKNYHEVKVRSLYSRKKHLLSKLDPHDEKLTETNISMSLTSDVLRSDPFKIYCRLYFIESKIEDRELKNPFRFETDDDNCIIRFPPSVIDFLKHLFESRESKEIINDDEEYIPIIEQNQEKMIEIINTIDKHDDIWKIDFEPLWKSFEVYWNWRKDEKGEESRSGYDHGYYDSYYSSPKKKSRELFVHIIRNTICRYPDQSSLLKSIPLVQLFISMLNIYHDSNLDLWEKDAYHYSLRRTSEINITCGFNFLHNFICQTFPIKKIKKEEEEEENEGESDEENNQEENEEKQKMKILEDILILYQKTYQKLSKGSDLNTHDNISSIEQASICHLLQIDEKSKETKYSTLIYNLFKDFDDTFFLPVLSHFSDYLPKESGIDYVISLTNQPKLLSIVQLDDLCESLTKFFHKIPSDLNYKTIRKIILVTRRFCSEHNKHNNKEDEIVRLIDYFIRSFLWILHDRRGENYGIYSCLVEVLELFQFRQEIYEKTKSTDLSKKNEEENKENPIRKMGPLYFGDIVVFVMSRISFDFKSSGDYNLIRKTAEAIVKYYEFAKDFKEWKTCSKDSKDSIEILLESEKKKYEFLKFHLFESSEDPIIITERYLCVFEEYIAKKKSEVIPCQKLEWDDENDEREGKNIFERMNFFLWFYEGRLCQDLKKKKKYEKRRRK